MHNMKTPEQFPPPETEEPEIIIKKSSEAPDEVKQSPFYDEEFWGRADSLDDIHIPDGDEALAFALGAHEIGHLVKAGQRNDASLSDFEATKAEELRAWEKGWGYLQKHLPDYYGDNVETIAEIEKRFGLIRDLSMQAVEISRAMYLPEGTPLGADEEYKKQIKEQGEKLAYSPVGNEIKKIFAQIKTQKLKVRPDWEKLTQAVRSAVAEIVADNRRGE